MKKIEWVAVAVLFFGFVWLVLLASGTLAKSLGSIRTFLPVWVLSNSLFLIPLLTPFAVSRARYNLALRFVLLGLLVICFSLVPLSYELFPRLAVAATVTAYVEWLVVWFWERNHTVRAG